ncbi:type II/IV secretion system protein [Candidatus Kaiserbacteria bacterium]|nr:type II/IV secretion system protein [Candidatus Kaiserbacteria bacterium]
MVQFNDSKFLQHLDTVHAHEEEELIKTLAPQYGYEYVNLQGYTMNPDALTSISEEASRKAGAVIFDKNRETVFVAVKNPNSKESQDLFSHLEKDGKIVRVFMCSTASLKHGWKRYKDLKDATAKQQGVLEINEEEIKIFMERIKDRKSVADEIMKIRNAGSARRISQTLQIMFAGALKLGTSDIHIEPEKESIRMRYRLDGVLQDVFELELFVYERVMSRLKLLSGMILNQRQIAQDGRFTFTIHEKTIEVRSSVIPGAEGESIVMRLLDPSVASFSMENIDLNPTLYNILIEQLKRPNGLIITTGPTGSGKTTALYSFLRKTHTPEVKIITIENPVEYKLQGIVQTQVDDDYTFGKGLRAILRQDPDIIMVGEIRDREVAETALHAAQTGHLVFTTLHTNSAVGGFPRLIDLGVDSRMIGSSVNIILGQRLVRLLCEHCKEAYQASEQELKLIKDIVLTHPHAPEVPEPLTIYKPTGCEFCNQTGFKGRSGVFEAIIVDDAVEEAVIRDPREHVILQAARPQGIPRMEHDGVDKILAGKTSLPELQRVVDLAAAIAEAKAIIHKDTSDDSLDDDFKTHVV